MGAESEDVIHHLLAAAAKVMKRLGLSESFRQALDSEPSDWGYAVKCGALCEAAVLDRLRIALPRSVGNDVERLTASQRLDWLKSLEVVEPHVIGVFRGLVSVRNHVVHDIRRAESFTLKSYYLDLQARPEKLDQLLSNLSWTNSPGRMARDFGLELFRDGHRAFLAVPLYNSLAFLQLSYERHEADVEYAAAAALLRSSFYEQAFPSDEGV